MSVSRLASGVFHGVTTKRALAGGLVLVQTKYAPRVNVSPHWHERPYFCYVERGAFEERSGSRTCRCGPGSLIFHPAGETHADRFGEEGGVCFNIEVAPSLWNALDDRTRTAMGRTLQFGGGVVKTLAGQMCREFTRTASSGLILEGLGLALVGEACRAVPAPEGGTPPAWLRRARDLVHDRFREPIGLASVAAELRLHPVHVARTFRRHVGVTVGEYIRAVRIEFACTELIAGGKTIADIAHASGFADHAHFCRCFRAQLGMSPTRFRALRSNR